jgi:hypothetical protein
MDNVNVTIVPFHLGRQRLLQPVREERPRAHAG